MCRVRASIIFAVVVVSGSVALQATRAQLSPVNSLPDSAKPAELGSLKICLRLEDHSPFTGAAQVRAFPQQGYELLGGWDRAKGEVVFYALPAGTYLVDVNAPGFSGRYSRDHANGRNRCANRGCENGSCKVGSGNHGGAEPAGAFRRRAATGGCNSSKCEREAS